MNARGTPTRVSLVCEILTQAPLFQLSIFSSGSSVVTIPNKTICHVTVSRIDAKAYRSLTFSPLFQYNWGQFFSVILKSDNFFTLTVIEIYTQDLTSFRALFIYFFSL